MGNINGSYVKGAAIHNTFNRAMTLHGISNFFVERTVTYDVKGLSFFIEDGIEENNIIRQNLAVYTKQSSSLLNPDVTPASFWVCFTFSFNIKYVCLLLLSCLFIFCVLYLLRW